MSRRVLAIALAALAVSGPISLSRAQAPAPSAANPDQQRELDFLRGLRERGYFDLALDVAENLKKDPSTQADFKPVLDYEIGRGILEEATRSADLEKRQALLEDARKALAKFTSTYPNNPLTPEALVQLARLYVERGHTAMLQSQEAQGEAEKKAKEAQARAAFAEARKAYDQAERPIQAAYESYPKFIPEGDPRRNARDRAHTALMEDQLQRAIVDYEEAQTYPMGSEERNKLLDTAQKSFETLYKRYRTQMSGLHARMLEGKCYEEKGEFGPAMGIYNELMEHRDPHLRDLQRQVGYFRIIVLGKRGEFALAADEAVRWLRANPNHKVTESGLGVQLELARDILAQLPEIAPKDKETAVNTAVEHLQNVVRYFSPYKPEALVLLTKYKPKSVTRLNDIARLTYEDAMTQADSAINTHDWDLAANFLRQAIKRAEKSHEIEKVNRARYFLTYVFYSSRKYYGADVLAEHLARRYPEGGLSAKAAEIGMASLTMAYNSFGKVQRLADLDRLVDLAEYTAKTWPSSEQADSARVTLGEIELGRGHYDQAADWLEGVRKESSRRLDAQVKAGDARWRYSQQLREEGKTKEADDQAKKALDLIAGALKERDSANVALTDPARMTNANALAEIHRAQNRPQETIKLLEPVANALKGAKPSSEIVPLYAATLSILLRAHLAVGKPESAIADMKILEGVSPSKSALTQLYFELGRNLKDEMDALEKKGDMNRYKKTQDAYRQFLQALASSKSGQSYDSLEWAGESMLNLNMPAEAATVLDQVLKTYTRDNAFLQSENAQNKLLRTRLKLVAAYRQQGQYDQARDLLQPIIDENPKLLDPLMEKGYLLEDIASANSSRGDWDAALSYWKTLALRLRRAPTKREEYFEAWYHAANALFHLGKKREAVSLLKGVMTINPSVGTPEMKARYKDFVKKHGG